jgi:hypothetical protein
MSLIIATQGLLYVSILGKPSKFDTRIRLAATSAACED